MATVLWDSREVIFNQKKYRWPYYISLLKKQKGRNWEKTVEKNVVSPRQIGMAKSHDLPFELLDYRLYLLDLVPSELFLFTNLKIGLGGQRFSSNKEVIAFINNYFTEKGTTYYLNRLKRWEHRQKKCVDLQGKYK